MKTTVKLRGCGRGLPFAGIAGALVLAAALGLPGRVQAQASYANPEQAADALIAGIATNDEAALTRVLGKRSRQVMGVQEVDIENRYAFLQKASQSRVVNVRDGRAELVVGSDPWTLPIPIVQGKDGQWRFDPVAAREEVLVRRIGANELAAIQAVRAYVDAQRDYALADRNGDGLLEYAQKLISSPGQRDGLIWGESLGDDSPLGEEFLPARPGEGYHGYRFKILTEQGPAARGGARSYLIGKHMVSGFALVAWPVKYGETGIMSFMVGSDGQVFQRNLGPNSAQVAAGIKQFNPDDTWKPAKP
jgi:Protein of unknown function (DUF2950)